MSTKLSRLSVGRVGPPAGDPRFLPVARGPGAPVAGTTGPIPPGRVRRLQSLIQGGDPRKPGRAITVDPAWHEDDLFWETVASVLFSRQRIKSAKREVNDMIKLLDLRRGEDVLDLGCGIGRHAVELAVRGIQVTGLDRTAPYLEQARKRALEKGVRVEWIREDMRRFRRPHAFDAVMNLYTTFGYFGEREDLQVARNVHRSLRPGGKFLIEVLGKEAALRARRSKATYRIGKTIVREERRIREGVSRLELHWEITQGTEKRNVSLSHHLYGAQELSSLLRRAGFRSTETFGDLKGRPYGKKAPRLVIVAMK